MARIWTPDDPDDLVRRSLAGESAQKLGREHGVSHRAVIGLLRRSGHNTRGRATIVPATPEMVTAYENGESVLAMSKRLGRNRLTITNRLRAAGVPLRGVDQNGSNSIAAQSRAALTKELTGAVAADNERILIDLLAAQGVNPMPQRAVGPYNIDIAVLPVAVEVLGSDWHNSPPKLRAMRKRTEDLIGAGWFVVYVIAPIHPQAAEKIVSLVEFARANPSAPTQYRVIRGNGNPSAAFRFEIDDEPLKPAPGRAL